MTNRKARKPLPTPEEAVRILRRHKSFLASLTKEQLEAALNAPEEAEVHGHAPLARKMAP